MKNNFDYTLSNDSDYMIKMIRENYTLYSKASQELKVDTYFSLQSIYECISQCNSDDIDHTLRKIKRFIKYVGNQSGINYGLNNSNGIYVIVKPENPFKQLFKRRKIQIN
jgi:hypothetical protein